MAAQLAGPDADRLRPALTDLGLDVDPPGPLIYVRLGGTTMADLEDTLTSWFLDAQAAASDNRDVVTVISDELVDGDDVAGCALGHALISGTRAWAMERNREGNIGNVVVACPEELTGAAATVAWLIESRAVSGEVLHAGRRRHGRQRL